MSDPSAATAPPEPVPEPPHLPTSATKDPEKLTELFDAFIAYTDASKQERKAMAEQIAALQEDLGLTKKQLQDFWDWAKTDPNEGGAVAAPGVPTPTPAAPTPTPGEPSSANGGPAPTVPPSDGGSPSTAPVTEQKRSLLSRIW